MSSSSAPRVRIKFTTQPAVVHVEEDRHSVSWCYQIQIENQSRQRLRIVEASLRLYRGARQILAEELGRAEIARHAKPANAASLWFKPEAYTAPHPARLAPGERLRWSDSFMTRPRGCTATRAVHRFVFRTGSGACVVKLFTVPLRPNRQATRLRLPFDGWWQMILGHEHFEHHMRGGGGLGLDFVGLAATGAPHTGRGDRLRDWPCYRREVLAPAAGRVARVVNDNPDSPPGRPLRVMHNTVCIDHGNGEQSFLAHFVPGSIVVREGQKVKAGQRLGLCGSSGYSLCPHVHYGLSRNGVGVPVVFSDYQVFWPVEEAPDRFSMVQRIDAGVVRHGEIVRHATP
jgi:hypothetical protein